ncbi:MULTISPECIES: DUF2249 domain-containing protein [Deefgea]|uniref:DUF2249 domain-containing protein n=1 Tax=Deefgea chitinilytica TaxID=570276 RepID=A0ABS2CDU5_9NEIS|nr:MULTISPECIES: DUF2249 domain-containing protein [Deefgea]MBM5572247.1 DUF2249 domain-containing protein [Deefgea chitinilytica]MBM9889482.1 DUF2249 domain-containing protein [Deefgea sp. CFH1-16]
MPNLNMDLRGFAPPEPIEQILQWLDVAIAGENLVAHLPHTPYPLYDYLRTRSCHWECVAQADGSAILTLYRD